MGFAFTESCQISGSPVQMRTAAAHDVPALLQYFARLSEEDRRLRFAGNRHPSIRQLEQAADSGYALVSCLPSGMVIGEALCAPQDGHSAAVEFSVASEWRRRGVARRLVAIVEREARKHGLRRLDATCLKDSGAIALLTGVGWNGGQAGDDAVLLRKTL